MDIRTKEAVRYLGYGNCAVDVKTLQLIQESFQELDRIAEVKSIYRIFEIMFPKENELQIGKIIFKSKKLYKNLNGCKKVLLFGATLGMNVDRYIHKYELTDMARAVVLQACAAAYLEEYCDELQNELENVFKDQNLYLRPRFSPGYGDFSILHQRDLLYMTDAAKYIGLTMTEGYMLNPTKSITAIIGLSETKEACHKKGCEECTKTDCLYRRS